MKPTWLWWSSGKDSAWALHTLRAQHPEVLVTALVTTVNRDFDRVSMHGVRRELLESQARAAGLTLHLMEIEWPSSNAAYEAATQRVLEHAREAGVAQMAFGDLFLEDVRTYREALLRGSGIEALFPLWGRDTAVLAHEMVDGGLDAWVTCLDPKQAPAELAGRRFDARFLEDLPAEVDPCGERGEFHTFASAGPMLEAPIPVAPGATIERDGLLFTELRAPSEAVD